jgi:nitrogen fixation/metabolism regulation signal transduction histidine kinase
LNGAEGGVIEADRGRLRQLLHNLLANACEALEGRGDARLQVETRLSVRPAGSAAEIIVEDNGPGFAPEVVERLFDPYVTTKPKGTGLGLAIVKKIIEEHGGKIEAQNIAGNAGEPVSGARVRIELPLLAANRNPASRTARDVSETRREKA